MSTKHHARPGCPRCGSKKLEIAITGTIDVTAQDNYRVQTGNTSWSWGSSSECRCRSCKHTSAVRDFFPEGLEHATD